MGFQIPFYSNSLKIAYTNLGVTEIEFQSKKVAACRPQNPMEKKIAAQIADYLNCQSKGLTLAVDWKSLQGTEFQKRAWKKMAKIPFGQVKTYGEVAASLSHVGAARAVGTACAKNPVLLVIPCHRIVGQSSLGGFSGGGLNIKRKLLELEGVTI